MESLSKQKCDLIQAQQTLKKKETQYDNWGKKLFKTTLPPVFAEEWVQKFTVQLEKKFGVQFGRTNGAELPKSQRGTSNDRGSPVTYRSKMKTKSSLKTFQPPPPDTRSQYTDFTGTHPTTKY